MSFWNRIFKKRGPKVVVPININPAMGTDGWRSSQDTVNLALAVISNPVFQSMYSIMVNERPSKTIYPITNTSQSLAAAQMFTSGYEYALQKLIEFGQFLPEPSKEPEMTFQEEKE